MNEPAALRLALGLALCVGCNTQPKPSPAPGPAPALTPDRLAEAEQLPDSETAFGLPIPSSMRVTRHFNDSTYFSGPLSIEETLEHVQKHVLANSVEVLNEGAVFQQAYIKGDEDKRLVRIEIAKAPAGTQVYIRDITRPPTPRGLSEAERWRRAGRKPDGTPLDPNNLY